MIILHTADWHMNTRLGRGIDRSEDINRALRQIARYLDDYHVDVMLVAGDLFSERSRPDDLRRAVAEIKAIFLPFLERGGTILAITGNHDSDVFFETLRDAFALVAPGRSAAGAIDATGRLYVAPNPRHALRLSDSQGVIVQFVMMPYPTARCYLRGDGTAYESVEAKHAAIQRQFTERLLQIEAEIDPTLPSVLVSHIHVRGAGMRTLYQISELDDVIFEPSDIPTHWAYVAYGHIHRPQPAIENAEHIRYAGSVERLDINECDDQKSVVLVEIGAEGRMGTPQLLPLSSTPIYRIEVNDPDLELPTLAERYLNAEDALVQYTLRYNPGVHNREALCRQVETIFPRWYKRTIEEIGGTGRVNPGDQRLQDVAGTVRAYLDTQLISHPHREELRALAEALLAEEAK